MIPLRLISLGRLPNDVLWLRYEVVYANHTRDYSRGNDFKVASVCCLAGEVTCEAPAAFMSFNQISNLDGPGSAGVPPALFLRHSEADVTRLVVKDGQLGHNPASALYLSAGPWRDKFKKRSE